MAGEDDKVIIMDGNPIEGFSFTGPFDEPDEAIRWAETEARLEADWWLIVLSPPVSR